MSSSHFELATEGRSSLVPITDLVRKALAGSSVSIPVSQGELELGTWQGIYFAEFDGPRLRRFTVSCVSG